MKASRPRRGTVAAALLAALGAATSPPVVKAQSLFEFDDWMQRIEQGNQDLQRRIAQRDRAGALGFARELEELYARMEKFFEVRGAAEPAVRMSREGRDLMAAAVRHLGTGNYGAARANSLRLARGCRACHIEYKPL
jgi:hypothetical protein